MPIGTIAAAGFASGLNLYATALLLGIAGRLGWAETPEAVQGNVALGVLAALFALEFVVDKIPWLDSAWDAAHTVIRPVGGALLGIGFDTGGTTEASAALVGGGFSLSAHSAKATTRATANLSPEPVSNVVLSLGEDGVVAGLVALALAYPRLAGVVALVLAATAIGVTVVLVRSLRELRRRWQARRQAASPTGPEAGP